ncbi:unnamed protein product [Protopolystoma xenopodis]|uniref:Uncharacterized protein n=1 Tax=Protopolystoma xenopodis TaxID=117903 RepID=A0A448X322_9PLAT|nr:unnamed protein product [Protopolystoma xenopodis]
MARLADDADYDAGEASGNVPSPPSDSANDHAYYRLRTRCVALGLPANNAKLRNHVKGLLNIETSLRPELRPQHLGLRIYAYKVRFNYCVDFHFEGQCFLKSFEV